MKRELNPTKNKAHEEIISKIDPKSKNIFCLTGADHKYIMDSLEINYIIMNDIASMVTMGAKKREVLKGNLSGKNIFFLTTSYKDYLAFLTDLKYYFKDTVQPYCIDLEVLKAYELIPHDEMSLNEYQLGLELLYGDNFKAFVDEVEKEKRHGEEWLNVYVKTLLENEVNRQLKKRQL
jgi:hypothetical protein